VAVKVLLDTDAYSAFMRGHGGVLALVRRAERVYLSTVVVGELMFGFRNGARYERNLKVLEQFSGNPYVELLPVTWTTAERFGRVAAALRAKGRPIPTNDIWIAAHAMEAGADLLSFDEHYRHVDGIAWVKPEDGT
jgi:tRNA(fMet)-specific endonuclease VapC